MTEVWYCDTSEFSEEDYQLLLERFEKPQQDEIVKFRFLKDRLFRILGRIMVCHCLKCRVEDIQKTAYGKPFVANNSSFNISHAGTIVAVAFSDQEIGLDIEASIEADFTGILSCFHPEELAEYHQSKPALHKEMFYRIWTRKEAFLKATGNGIVKGLNLQNCLLPHINYSSAQWHIESFYEIENYSGAFCQKNTPVSTIQFRKLNKTIILQQYESLFI